MQERPMRCLAEPSCPMFSQGEAHPNCQHIAATGALVILSEHCSASAGKVSGINFVVEKQEIWDLGFCLILWITRHFLIMPHQGAVSLGGGQCQKEVLD